MLQISTLTWGRLSIYQDLPPWKEDRIPEPYQNNKAIRGIYKYLMKLYRSEPIGWENTIREFCKEVLKQDLKGKGSVAKAAELIQDDNSNNWGKFVTWLKKKKLN